MCLESFAAVFKKVGVTAVGDGQLAVTNDGRPLRILSPTGRTTEVDPGGNCRTVSSKSGESYQSVMDQAYADLKAASRASGTGRALPAEGLPSTLAACKNSDLAELRSLIRGGAPVNSTELKRPSGAAQ